MLPLIKSGKNKKIHLHIIYVIPYNIDKYLYKVNCSGTLQGVPVDTLH